MFKFFENLLEPFPEKPPEQAPSGLWAFCRYYSRGAEKYLFAMALFSGLIGVIEAGLFGFLGKMVDWLSVQDPATFLQAEKGTLIGLLVSTDLRVGIDRIP